MIQDKLSGQEKSFIKNYAATQSDDDSCQCEKLWTNNIAKSFSDSLLLFLSKKDAKIWEGYSLEKPVIVLNGGQLLNGRNCIRVFKNGKILTAQAMESVPAMLTPLYSYYLDYSHQGNIEDSTFFKTVRTGSDFHILMRSLQVDAAVYMPVEFPKFPFTIPTLTKIQLALHESFHIEVQLRYWYTQRGKWPAWDKQPDRQSVQLCYSYNDSLKTMIRAERNYLSLMIEALLENDKQKAIKTGQEFIDSREKRYALVQPVKIKSKEGDYIDCREAEDILELEEGLADYASWTILFNTGLVSKTGLLQRYRAEQLEYFYLTGAMLFHTMTLMEQVDGKKLSKRVWNSSNSKKGGLYELFKKSFQSFSDNR